LTNNPDQIPIGKRILSSMLNFGMANVMTKIIGFLLIPLYTNYLTPEDYGIAELCGSLLAFSVIFMRLGVPGSVNRFYFDFKDDENKLNDYITTIHHLLVYSSITVGIIIGITCYLFSSTLLTGVLFFPFIVLILINSGFSANSDLQKRLLQSKEKSAYMAKLNIALALIGILLTIFFVVLLKLGALGLILSQTCTTLIFFIQSQYYLRSYIKGKFNIAMLKDSLKYGVGLLPHHLFAVLAPLLSKGILNSRDSLAALGIFSLALRFIQPLDIIYNIFNQSFNPIYFSLRKKNDTIQIKKVYLVVWLSAIIIFMITVLLLPSLVPLITPIRFHKSAELIPILALGFIGQVSYMLFLQESYYDKNTKSVSLITGSGLTVNLIVTILGVNQYGVYAIAWAYSAGFITWAIVGFLLSKKHFFKYIKIETFLIGLLIIISSFFLSIYIELDNFLLRTIISVIATMLAFFILNIKNKKETNGL
jgi:O-antigen/teichoic acid export membrane protein